VAPRNKTAEEDVAEAHARQQAGFDFFKLKIGVKPLAKEIAIAFAVRAALPHTSLCADANCGLTPAAARSYVEKTRKAKLMFVEQPLAYDDVEGLKKLVRGTKVPIGVDEGIHSFADITTSAKAGAGGVSLKLIKLGGIIAAIEAGKLCQRLGCRSTSPPRLRNRASPARRRCILPARCRRPIGASASRTSIWRGHRAPTATAQTRPGRPARRSRPRHRSRRAAVERFRVR